MWHRNKKNAVLWFAEMEEQQQRGRKPPVPGKEARPAAALALAGTLHYMQNLKHLKMLVMSSSTNRPVSTQHRMGTASR